MAEEFKVRFKTVFRNVLPAIVVMAAGLAGTYLVYNNYLGDRVVSSETASEGDANSVEPAAGGDETFTAAPAAAPAATGGAAAQKVYNDEGEDSGNGPDTATAPASGTATPPATGDTPAKPATATPAPDSTPPAAK